MAALPASYHNYEVATWKKYVAMCYASKLAKYTDFCHD